MKLEDVTHSVSVHGSVYLSLAKLAGKKIVDVKLGISTEFGEPTLQIYRIEFDDGTSVGVGGEHDLAYIESSVTEDDSELLEDLNEQVEAAEAALREAKYVKGN